MMHRTCLLLAPLALLLSACLENEEEIEVRADGSLRITATSNGNVSDFGQGYPIALDGPWQPDDETTAAWMATVGPLTGGPDVAAALEAGAWPTPEDDQNPEVQLTAIAEFAAVKDWPRWTAPPSDPYRTAYLERSAELSIEKRGRFTVYTFERTYHARDYARFHVGEEYFTTVLDDLEAENATPTVALEPAARLMLSAANDMTREFARDALDRGDPDGGRFNERIGTTGREQVVERALDEVGTVLTAELVLAALAEFRAIELGEVPSPNTSRLQALEDDMRDAVRRALEAGLAELEVDPAARNAVREAYEWRLTHHDHTNDLMDEEFKVSVELPGILVSGNYQNLEGVVATWEFEGRDLLDKSRTMRLVSIVE